MQVIVYFVQLFTKDQKIDVVDTERSQVLFSQTVDLEDVVPAICAIANKLNINEVRLGGNATYAVPFAEEIKTAYSLNYGTNNINVEVL